MNKDFYVLPVNFAVQEQKKQLCELLIKYSADPMGGGKPLDHETAEASINLLAEHTYAFSFIAYDRTLPIGFANCFETVATFAGKPAMNIHDLAVVERYRSLGIATTLLRTIESFAKSRHCHKLTLEVLEGNTPAKNTYVKFGFEPYQLGPDSGIAQFWQKSLR